jgi:hypothetical protein
LLKPGGKLFARMGTLYNGKIHPDVKENLVKEIKKFIEYRTRPVPGFIPGTIAFAKDPSDENPMNYKNPMNKFVFDKDVTKILLESDGFKIELCGYNYADLSKRLLVIARKPQMQIGNGYGCSSWFASVIMNRT